MYKNDKIKAIVAVILFGTIAISYGLRGKDEVTKTIVAVAMAVWLGTVYFIRKKHKNEN